MYAEFDKINAFLWKAENLLHTSKRMEDIFNAIINNNLRNNAVEYYNAKGKLKHYKYKQMRKNVIRYASAISHLLQEKVCYQPVALKLANSHSWGEIFWALLMSGYKPLLIDAKLTRDGTLRILEQSHAIAIISDDSFSYGIEKISSDDIFDYGNDSAFIPNWENEILFCSSGTTGDIKLMVYNGESMCHQICCSLDVAKDTKEIMYPKKYGKVKILAMIPFHHVFGFIAVFLWFSFYGKTLVYPSAIIPSEIQKICLEAGVTHLFSVPLFWDNLALSVSRKIDLIEDEKKKAIIQSFKDYNLGKINKVEAGIASKKVTKDKIQGMLLGPKMRFCISGGGFLSMSTLTTLNSLGYPLCNGYGMTEVGVTSVELSSNVDERLKSSIGHAFHGVEYQISKDGELLIKSKALHVREIIGGIEKNCALDENGFFHSGDIVSIKDDKYYIKGRMKDIIINADGENIFPEEIEDSFKTIPHLEHLCVVGIKGEKDNTEKVALVLELDNQTNDTDLENIREMINKLSLNLPHATKIDSVYLTKKKMPLANGMKVKRFVIKKAIEEGDKDFVSIEKKQNIKTFEGFSENEIQEILIPVRTLFSEVLILPTFKIENDSHWIDELGGDSMNYVELITKIQDKFQITLPEEKLGVMSCVNDFVYEIALLKKDSEKNSK